MNRVALFSVGCVLALVPSIASAGIKVTIPDQNISLPAGAGQTSIDIMGQSAAPDENEQLFAYDLGFQLTKMSGDNGLTFATPQATKPTSNFVFGDQPTDYNIAPGATATSFVLNVVNNGSTLPDITGTPVKLATIVLNADATSTGGQYKITFIPDRTDFASGDPNRADPTIAQDISSFGTVTVTVVPEPASLSLIGIGGLLALRRRRTA